jgi:hypothetical protein
MLLTSPKKARTSGEAGAVAGYSPELTKALKSVVKIFTTMARCVGWATSLASLFHCLWECCSRTVLWADDVGLTCLSCWTQHSCARNMARSVGAHAFFTCVGMLTCTCFSARSPNFSQPWQMHQVRQLTLTYGTCCPPTGTASVPVLHGKLPEPPPLWLFDFLHELSHLQIVCDWVTSACTSALLQQTKCTATGFVIAPLGLHRILTNAHAVANQVAVKVRKHGSAQKFNARVLAVGHEVSRQHLMVPGQQEQNMLCPRPACGAGLGTESCRLCL